MLLAAFVGLSLPVVGAGVTLASHVSPKVTILGFAIVVSVGIVASALKLAGGPSPQARRLDGGDHDERCPTKIVVLRS